MRNLVALFLCFAFCAHAEDLPTKPYLSLSAIKKMVAAAEAEAAKRNVSVTICIMDDSGNILFLQKGDRSSIATLEWAQRKARHAAFSGSPSKNAADAVSQGRLATLAYPYQFPNQGGLPIKYNGHLIGGISASGAPSDVDEAIAQAGINALVQ